MKPEKIIHQGLKSANILLKNVQKRAAELDHMKGELVIITDANSKTFKGFSGMLSSSSWTTGLPPDIQFVILLNATGLSWHQNILTNI